MKICIRYFKHREDAVSVLNQSFLKVLQNLEDYDQTRSWENWISSITIRTCIDEYRKHKKYKDLVDGVDNYDHLEATFKPVYNDIIVKLSQEEVDSMLGLLTSEEKFVFNLFEFESYTHEEIAAQLDVSVRSSKRYLQKARVKLRAELEARIKKKSKV